MMYNHASRLITNLIFDDIDAALQRITGVKIIAHSPIMDSAPRSIITHFSFIISTYNKEINIHISINGFSDDTCTALQYYFVELSKNLKNIFQIVFKKNITINHERNINKKFYIIHYKEIVVSSANTDHEQYLQLLLPIDFFKFFSKNISQLSSSEVIESEVLSFFKNPKWIIPNVLFLISALSNIELNNLINQLQRNNLLTPYQIFLIIHAYPELSGAIKSVLSKNIINDVIQCNKKFDALKINRRDIAGGIFSIEESIYFIMRDGSDIHYSQFLGRIQKIIQSSLNLDILLTKTFSEWISEIIADGLLYATLSVTEDTIAAKALSKDYHAFIEQFRKYISEIKINDIRQLINQDTSYDTILRARIDFLTNYRKQKMKRIHSDPGRLEYLLINFNRASDYLYILLSVGWFTLSTAMKGMNKINTDHVLRNLPVGAKILIEDVLKGIVNPNILHDEIQINKAKISCVESILQLYNDGIINLEI
jgi:hypothetical protein